MAIHNCESQFDSLGTLRSHRKIYLGSAIRKRFGRASNPAKWQSLFAEQMRSVNLFLEGSELYYLNFERLRRVHTEIFRLAKYVLKYFMKYEIFQSISEIFQNISKYFERLLKYF